MQWNMNEAENEFHWKPGQTNTQKEVNANILVQLIIKIQPHLDKVAKLEIPGAIIAGAPAAAAAAEEEIWRADMAAAAFWFA